ncbi:hypothetical protein Ct61P_06320 [Colletotrichum tofieldiae]|nr:hypothetical protein Ct61P_06320 [Colletotrichum tofieldiae]
MALRKADGKSPPAFENPMRRLVQAVGSFGARPNVWEARSSEDKIPRGDQLKEYHKCDIVAAGRASAKERGKRFLSISDVEELLFSQGHTDEGL